MTVPLPARRFSFMWTKMNKPGRNNPCPCGSGKKYKRCCGVNVGTGPEVMPPTASTPPRTRRNLFGLPGLQHQILMRGHFSDPNDPRNIVDIGGVPGRYKVVFTLNRPGFSPLPDRQISADDNLRGDSHIAIAMPAYDDPNLPGANEIVFTQSLRMASLSSQDMPMKKASWQKSSFPHSMRRIFTMPQRKHFER
jgi:SEC-C motif-containing protein